MTDDLRLTAIDQDGEPVRGSAEDRAMRLALGRDVDLIGESADDEDVEDIELLDADVAAAAADTSDRRGPDEDDAEAWVDEVQGRS